jgi:uncharacterized membrane protein
MFSEKNILRLFDFSLILKGIHAAIEIVGGFFIYFIGTGQIVSFATYLTQEELTEEPNDFFANLFLHSAQNLSIGTKTFAAVYLLIHGLVNLGIVFGLLRGKMWSYPVGLSAIALFVLYQMYRLHLEFSLLLLVLTLFDLLVMWLIYHEYRLRVQENKKVIGTL